MRADAAVSDVTKGTGALVRAGHCAQPGDNAVDRSGESVGTAGPTLDYVWSPVATMSLVPKKSNSTERPSTIDAHTCRSSDLRKRVVSTESTALMTTSLRYGSDMTQDVRQVLSQQLVADRLTADRRPSFSDSQQAGGYA